jgi:hypothetical protein
MPDENRLLVPIDGSDHALRALALVIKRVASDRQLRICVLNVQLPLPPSLFVTPSMIAQHHKQKSKEDLARALRMLHRKEVACRESEQGPSWRPRRRSERQDQGCRRQAARRQDHACKGKSQSTFGKATLKPSSGDVKQHVKESTKKRR